MTNPSRGRFPWGLGRKTISVRCLDAEFGMISTRSFLVTAAVGALVLGAAASANALEARNQLRQQLQDKCNSFSGRAIGICMEAAARQISDFSQFSRTAYRDCLADGKSRRKCDTEREAYWSSLLRSGD